MIPSSGVEYLFFEYLKAAGDGRGSLVRSTSLPALVAYVRENGPGVGVTDVRDEEVCDALKRLHDRGFLKLDKCENAGRGFMPFPTYCRNDSKFFYNGDFRMEVTPGGRPYFEELKSVVPQQIPRRRHRIGF